MIIPGSRSPKNFNSFLYPLVKELQELEGKLIEEKTNKNQKDEMIRETVIISYQNHSGKVLTIEIGHPPHDIFKYHNGYKAVEWKNWMILFSLPLLKAYLDKRYFNKK
ncbi:hypothetical protein C1645_735125 [Glomus cerebriforme]|uniref:Uncharacterized protein n=1 Tax=Glomus cerebriforme TaxID=658196 RepID=A0A397TCB2_9GLOM|nr:hypothetical protein C1645_735125 [Glomus cerebriforme]